jgi:DNA-binding LacI/PurR family transcriptional regulator
MTQQIAAPDSDLTYQQIKSMLRARVGTQWAAGTRLPPIRSLATQLKAGQRNTHRAVQELVAEGVLTSSPRRGTFIAPAKRVYLPLGESDGMIEQMAQSFMAELHTKGITTIRGPYPQDPDLSSIDTDAIALIQNERTHKIKVRPGQIVTVIATHEPSPWNFQERYDLVSVDQRQGGALAGRFLREAGITDACFIGTGNRDANQYLPLDAQRLAGFEEGFGRKLARKNRLFARIYFERAGAEMVAPYLALNPRPRAVFTVCDDIGLGFLLGAAAHGLVAGKDFDLVGFDGQWRGRKLADGPLSSVAVPSAEMGRTGAQMLVSRLENPNLPPRTIHLGCSMLPGSTVDLSAAPSQLP